MSVRLTVFCLGNYRMVCDVTKEEGDTLLEAMRKREPVRVSGNNNTSIVIMPDHIISAEYMEKPPVVAKC